MAEIDVWGRERRLERALRDVGARYRITALPRQGEVARFTVAGGRRPYQVTVRTDWALVPICTCPDASEGARAAGVYCKHAIAVLLGEPDLRCQLLDLLL